MMSMRLSWIPNHLKVPFQPIPNPMALVCGPNVRFTILASRLIRLEFSPQDRFEDRPSQAFWYRQQPVPEFEIRRSAAQLEITTEHLHLCYAISSKKFRWETL